MDNTNPNTPITAPQLQKAVQTLQRYKQGKAQLEKKIIENEQFWKLRHWQQLRPDSAIPATGWLWNVIVSRHADMQDGFPEANILAREPGDTGEAAMLSSVVPVVLEQNDFRSTYSDCCWYKLKQGCAVYGVFWDASKLGGLGDVAVRKIDLLNLFWEPGITDIQRSKNLFHVELIDNEQLEQRYPQLAGKLGGSSMSVAKYIYDESVDTSDKTAVVDWYYHSSGGRLEYCKFVGDEVLYATQNEPGAAGWYAHGLYPFVFDSLFDIEGSPCGYGYTDVCKDTQLNIDRLNHALIDNALKYSKVRYFIRQDGGVNEEEFADWSRDFVHTSASLGEDSIRQVRLNSLNGLYVGILNNQIEALKQTAGSTDVTDGISRSGVTAASAIAALQEAGGKTSRDLLNTTYNAYKRLVYLIIELIRQFYDVPRQFRITGERGERQFVSYSNSLIKPYHQGVDFGVDLGLRAPQFDVEVHVQRANAYTKLSQNEFALQLYQNGVLNAQNAGQALMLLDLMDFKGRDKLIESVQRQGEIMQRTQPAAAQAAKAAEITERDVFGNDGKEHTRVANARKRAREATQPA